MLDLRAAQRDQCQLGAGEHGTDNQKYENQEDVQTKRHAFNSRGVARQIGVCWLGSKKLGKGKGILITIDETQAASHDDLVAIATAVQHVITDAE
ncbi:hypothetical protein MCC01989_01560 [Bifidobacteriaceae bacterium MCC01989]|nr:hypothetical protein MCC01989_01560 [Bifidobacteriaceae bacterium MCC01989]